jgi:putative transposase
MLIFIQFPSRRSFEGGSCFFSAKGTVSYESIRHWCIKIGARFARRLKRLHQGHADTFFIYEVLVKINRKQPYLWRAVGQDGEVIDVYLQASVMALRQGASPC